MTKSEEIFSKEYVSDTETKISVEKKENIAQEKKEAIFSKEYVSDTETKITIDKKENIIVQTKKEETKIEEEMKRFGISKPQRFIIKGKITQ
jgi:hypothetical protein